MKTQSCVGEKTLVSYLEDFDWSVKVMLAVAGDESMNISKGINI